MKFLNKYTKFFESSQSKKIRQYIGYSVVLEWYRNNKEKIAKLLNCDTSELADEDTLMKQSYELVNRVINTQTSGNSGISGTDIPGFESFKQIENNLIHDILHNMFDVKTKEFDKSLTNIEFTESEIIEEIECLAIEESFMKFMNITYLKTDFINANINQLASYLMMAIIKNDPDRIKKILDKEVEPYLEIYGKKYPVEGTPFEDFFTLFKNREADSRNFRISDSDDFKDYMIHLINVGEGISNSSGDRGQYPDGEFYGLKSWYDLTDNEKKSYIEDNFEDKRYSDRDYYLLLDSDINDIDKFEFDYTVIGLGRNPIVKKEPDKTKIDIKVKKLLDKLGFEDNNVKYGFDSALQVFPNDINYDTEEIKVVYVNKHTDKVYKGYIQIDNIPNYLTKQLNLESFNFKYNMDEFKDRDDLRTLPIRGAFIDNESRTVDMDKWFDFLEKTYGKDNEHIVYSIGEQKYIGITYTDDNDDEEDEDEEDAKKTKYSGRIYSIMDTDDFESRISEKYNDGNDNIYFDDDHEFINIEEYRKKSFDEIAKLLFYDGDSMSIMRRNFRVGDIIKNNTNLGNISKYDTDDNNTKTIKTKNPKHTYIDFYGTNDPEKSISKATLTDNGRKLKELLDNFRGYVINNFKRIKEDFKKNKAKFEPHIETFKKLNLNDLKSIEATDFGSNLEINFELDYNYGEKNIHPATKSNKYQTLYNFYRDFDKIEKFTKLVTNIEDIDYLKNFVNISGNVKTTKDYFDFKKVIISISKKNIFKWRNPITDVYSSNTHRAVDVDITTAIKQVHEKLSSGSKLDINNPDLQNNIKPIISKVMQQVYPNIRIKNIEVTDFTSFDLEFKITVDI